jgi:lipopolysaccharide export system permease protein
MHTLDRMLLFAFVRSYLIVLVSLLALYVVIDLFTNLDDFAGRGTFTGMLRHIGTYYALQTSQIFDRLSEAICLLAAMFTVAWMQRNNELLPQLSAGIPTHRVLRPVLLGSAAVICLGPLNQEFVIPRIADDLQIPRDDPELKREVEVRGAFDTSGVHVEGAAGKRRERTVRGFSVTFPESGPTGMAHLAAEEAEYVPAGDPREVPGYGTFAGGWLLYQTTPESMPDAGGSPLVPLGPRRFFLKTREADFDAMTRRANWHSFASTRQLRATLNRPDPQRLSKVAVLFHMRFTRPVVGALMVLLGLSIILRDQNRHVLISSGLCLGMCAVFYAAVFGCKYLGENDLLSPPLAAWVPVFVFGPLAVAYFDAVQT